MIPHSDSHASSKSKRARAFSLTSRIIASTLSIVAALSAAQAPQQSALDQLHSLRAKTAAAIRSDDWQSNLDWSNKLKQLLNGSPNSHLTVARAEAHLGNFDAAFHEIDQFVKMGQATDLIENSPDFAPLRAKKQFAAIASGMKANQTPISHASTAFLLSDPGLLTEDIDFDPVTKRFLITSIREKKIIWAKADGTTGEFARTPDNLPIFAFKIDSTRGVVWATEVALQDYSFAPKEEWGRSVILCFNLKDGRLLRQIEGPQGSALGDLTLTANGDVIASDGQGGAIYRLRAKGTALERVDGGDFTSPQTSAMHPDGKHLFVPDYLRGIGLLDPETKQVQWLPMEGKFALNGIDGLYFSAGKLIAVQNGTSPERVVIFTLDSTLTKISSEEIVERSTETLGDPTHGVVIGTDFYYIANSGWDTLDDHGVVKPDSKITSPRVMRIDLNDLSASTHNVECATGNRTRPPIQVSSLLILIVYLLMFRLS